MNQAPPSELPLAPEQAPAQAYRNGNGNGRLSTIGESTPIRLGLAIIAVAATAACLMQMTSMKEDLASQNAANLDKMVTKELLSANLDPMKEDIREMRDLFKRSSSSSQ